MATRLQIATEMSINTYMKRMKEKPSDQFAQPSATTTDTLQHQKTNKGSKKHKKKKKKKKKKK